MRFCKPCLWTLTLTAIIAGTPHAAADPMFSVLDLGTLGGTQSFSRGINNAGQVVGRSLTTGNVALHAIRTAPDMPINSLTDDLGTLGSSGSEAFGINDAGQVVGNSFIRAFRTAPNMPINPLTDDLGALGGVITEAFGINSAGQVVGRSLLPVSSAFHAFRTAPNMPINPLTDDLGALGGASSRARGINNAGQVVGELDVPGGFHAFRTAPNMPINPLTDDLGTLGGFFSSANGINNAGQVVGVARTTGNVELHAFRTAPNMPINPLTDDLGTLGGTFSLALGINSAGQVVGHSSTTGDAAQHAFFFDGTTLFDLNNLIPAASGLIITSASGINDLGQIAADAVFLATGERHAVLLTPKPAKVNFLTYGVHDVPSNHRGDVGANEVFEALKGFDNSGDGTAGFWNTGGSGSGAVLQDLVDNAKNRVSPGDHFVFYINAHGAFNLNGDELPVSAQVSILPPLRTTTTGDEYFYLSQDSSQNITDDTFSGFFDDPVWDKVNKLFIIDTCYAGGFWNSGTILGDSGDLSQLPKSAIIAASLEADLSLFDPVDRWGFLGHAVVRALNSLKSAGNSIDFDQLVAQVQSELPQTVVRGFVQGFPEDNWLDPIDLPVSLFYARTPDFDFQLIGPAVVPEPSTLALGIVGLVMTVGCSCLRRKGF